MKALVKHEVIGQTGFGDPEILVTVLEPHPKAGFQLLMRSTASMDHMSKKLAETGKTTYLVYPYPNPDNHSTLYHGSCEDVTMEQAVGQIESYIDWLHHRELLREKLWDLGGLISRAQRCQEGLWETNAIDFEEEWKGVLVEVARVEMLMKGWRDDQVREEHVGPYNPPV